MPSQESGFVYVLFAVAVGAMGATLALLMRALDGFQVVW
jgi:hypothetical protein